LTKKKPPHPRKSQYVISGLLDGWVWFDDALQQVLGSGFNTSQSILLLRLSEGITRQSEIARSMRLSKQAVRHIAADLISAGYLTLVDDPKDRRSKILTYTPKGRALAKRARQVLFDLEDLLANRLGEREYKSLRHALDAGWGSSPVSRDTLPKGKRKA
jgi:DNA-binding MarR family transcriptional regulator